MNPAKVDRNRLNDLTDLPNIGKACADHLRQIGIAHPAAVKTADPVDLYERLSMASGVRVDPCMLDVFISITRFMTGEEARPWWFFTEERKAMIKEKK